MANDFGRYCCAYFQALPSAILVTALAAGSAQANPQGGVVVGGSAQIQTSGGRVDVTQTSQRAVINWDSFSIGKAEVTNFIQPNANAVALNRVTGGSRSDINGLLSANGNIVVVNPNGIVFGRDSQVNVAGIIATTTDIAPADFMAGKLAFNTPGRSDATVINQGSISVKDGGLAAFVAPGVENAGAIQAKLGTVSLASGNKFTVDLYGDKLVRLQVGDAIANDLRGADGQPLAARVDNKGSVIADGGTVLLTVDAARSIVDNVINTGGVIQARQAVEQGGRIVLKGRNGAVRVGGIIEAANSIEVQGSTVTLDGTYALSSATGAMLVTAATIVQPSNVALTRGTLTRNGAVVVDSGTPGNNAPLSPNFIDNGPAPSPTPQDRSPSPARGAPSFDGAPAETTMITPQAPFFVPVDNGPGGGPTAKDRSQPLPRPIRDLSGSNPANGQPASGKAAAQAEGSSTPQQSAASNPSSTARNAAAIAARQSTDRLTSTAIPQANTQGPRISFGSGTPRAAR